jgi:hypothetical protein
VLTVGNHDDDERSGDSRFTALREIQQSVISPTLNLLDGPGGAVNAMGLRQSIASTSDDIVLWYDIYAGMFNLSFTGNLWTFGHQSYPATMANGAKCWGQPAFTSIVLFSPEPQCFTDFEGFTNSLAPPLTSNPSGIPDSLRVFLNHQQTCFRFAISLGCNSSDGGYFDNVSLAFIDQPGIPGQASASSTVNLGSVVSDIWHFVNDTFPANETAGLPGTAPFDTTTALIRTGLNTAQGTNNALRFDIPGDSSLVVATNATVGSGDDPALVNVRVDLVFRILPGPGTTASPMAASWRRAAASSPGCCCVRRRTRRPRRWRATARSGASTLHRESARGRGASRPSGQRGTTRKRARQARIPPRTPRATEAERPPDTHGYWMEMRDGGQYVAITLPIRFSARTVPTARVARAVAVVAHHEVLPFGIVIGPLREVVRGRA